MFAQVIDKNNRRNENNRFNFRLKNDNELSLWVREKRVIALKYLKNSTK